MSSVIYDSAVALWPRDASNMLHVLTLLHKVWYDTSGICICQLVALIFVHLATCKVGSLWRHPSVVLVVTGALAARSLLGSDCKGQCKSAEDYHEHWRS